MKKTHQKTQHGSPKCLYSLKKISLSWWIRLIPWHNTEQIKSNSHQDTIRNIIVVCFPGVSSSRCKFKVYWPISTEKWQLSRVWRNLQCSKLKETRTRPQKKIRKKKNTRQGLKNRQEENTQKGRTSSK